MTKRISSFMIEDILSHRQTKKIKIERSLREIPNFETGSQDIIFNVSMEKGKENRRYECVYCQKCFDRPSLLKRHIRTHTGEKPFQCNFCEKCFSTSSSLNTHKRIHTNERPFNCEICKKSFTASSNLYYHKMTHSGKKPHKCPHCEKSFLTPGYLKAHLAIHTGIYPFHCKCGTGFTKSAALTRHLLVKQCLGLRIE